jgi:hypothetical protein
MLLMVYDLADPTCNSVQQPDHMQSHMLLIYPTPTECRPQIKMMMYDYTTINLLLDKSNSSWLLEEYRTQHPQEANCEP